MQSLGAENLKANFANTGDIVTRARQLISPPNAEVIVEALNIL